MNALVLGLALPVGALPCIDRYAYCPRVHVDDCSDDYLATRIPAWRRYPARAQMMTGRTRPRAPPLWSIGARFSVQ